MPEDWFRQFDKRVVRVNEAPLQIPDRDERVRTVTVGGPETRRDARLTLSVAELEGLLEVARASPTRRVVINECGFKIDVFRAPSGYVYEVWHFSGRPPVPETHAVLGGQS